MAIYHTFGIPRTTWRGGQLVEIHSKYVSITKAAELLQVSKSTLWRWINNGDIPAFRFGHRRVLIQQSDLNKLIKPARGEVTTMKETAPISIEPLTEAEVERGLEAMKQADALLDAIRSRTKGKPLADSAPLIRKAREERAKQLLDL